MPDDLSLWVVIGICLAAGYGVTSRLIDAWRERARERRAAASQSTVSDGQERLEWDREPATSVPADPAPGSDWFEVLGVDEQASEEEIRATWRRLVSQYQPDKVSGLGPELVAVAERETRLKGQLHGPHSSWFESGKLKSESTYVNGEAEGTMVFYFPNGKKEIEGKVVNGNRDGVWFYFNEDGTIQLQMLYASGVLKKERKENGVFKEYYDDEQLMSEVTYRKGKREGAFKEYHDNGTWLIKPLPADPISGAPADMERVLEGQTVKRTGTYVNDLLEGEVKEFDAKGKVVKVTRYLAGVEQP